MEKKRGKGEVAAYLLTRLCPLLLSFLKPRVMISRTECSVASMKTINMSNESAN